MKRYEKELRISSDWSTLTEINIFDSLSEVSRFIQEEMESNEEYDALVREHVQPRRGEFLGRRFRTLSEAFEAANKPWGEGSRILADMEKELSEIEIPVPISTRRRSCFKPDFGDEVCYDRLRAGQDYWRSIEPAPVRTREKTATFLINVASSGDIPSDWILWRGAAALVASRKLEEEGYRTEIWTTDFSIGTFIEWIDRRYDIAALNAIKIKSLESDLNPDILVSAVSGWYYRTTMFALNASSQKSRYVDPGLGLPTITPPDAQDEITTDKNRYVFDGIYSKDKAIERAKEIITEFAEGVAA